LLALPGIPFRRTLPNSEEKAHSPELAAWSDGPAVATESFRLLMASLMRSSFNGGHRSAILFTSAAPGEGKTTVVANLGRALAESRRRVVVVDADFRLPRLNKVFGLPNDRGLTTLLNEDIPLTRELLSECLSPTAMPGLFLLANGPELENVSQALYSLRMREVLALLRQEFDCVLIDAPPILHVADARVLDQLADGVVLVIRSGVTSRDSILRAHQYLHDDGAVVLGTILNDWKPTKGEQQSYQYYQ
jgi:capsular exopolysaccharide synthesis family protein